ncbi:MAG: hypothetical protein SGI89_03130 [bacterium]|nr:hypothetical protein [bacterium]
MKYFSKIHVFKSGINTGSIEIDEVTTSSYQQVREVYIECIDKIEKFLKTHGDLIDKFHLTEHEGIKPFHSNKFIYYFRIDIFSSYDFNESHWLYRVITKKNYPEYSDSAADAYLSLLSILRYELNKKKSNNWKA